MSQAVVFLARGVDGGLNAARAFLDSYRAHPAGRPHELIVIAKGWESVPGRGDLETLVRAEGGRTVDLPDDGYDWGAYMRIAPQLDHEWVCFLNTHSRILADGWLDKLRTAAEMPGVGAAGATGSWGTMAPVFGHVWPIVKDIGRIKGWRRAAATGIYGSTLGYFYELAKHAPRSPAFPNPHLRSNTFLLPRHIFLDFAKTFAFPTSKAGAFVLESGRRGLTRFLSAMGLSVVVTGRDGTTYEQETWIGSHTFRVPGQRNLLVSDNQTRNYDAAPAWSRRILERSAWGRTFTPLENNARAQELAT